MPKPESRGKQLCRFHARAREQKLVRHFTQRDARRKSRKREECWTGKNTAKGSCKFEVRDRRWRNGIDGAVQTGCEDAMQDARTQIVKRNPTHILPSGSDPTADTKLERKNDRLQRAAFL